MRVLQVSRIFPPLLTAQAIAVAKSACSLHDAGAHVDVACGRAFKQFKIAPWKYATPYTTIRIEDPGYRMRSIIRALLVNPIFPPTPWALEAGGTLASASQPNAYDVVFATFGPVGSLQAAVAIAKKKRLPLVLEFNDPFPYVLQEALFEDKDYLVRLYRRWYTESWMRTLMSATNAYVVPSSRMKKSLVSYLESRGWAKTPVEVIPHMGWGRDGGPSGPAKAKLVISHLGAFYSRRKGGKELFIRCALPVVRALEQVLKEDREIADSLEVRFVGGLDAPSREYVAAKGLDRHVTVEPPVDYATSLEKMHEADVLLLLEEEMLSSPFLPAKFADYVITRKPILSLSPLDSEVGDIMGNHFGVLANIHSVQSVVEHIRRIWHTWKQGALDTLRVPESVAREFGSEVIGRKYLDVFEVACRGSATAESMRK